MKFIHFISSISLAAIISSCSPGIETPKGTSQGYSSARLIERNPEAEVTDDAAAVAKEKRIHRQIQSSLKNEFTRHGLSYGKSDAQLKVAYLVMIQNNAITFHYNDFFGKGRDADALAEYAHLQGVTKSKRDEFFERVIIVVDVIDTKTNKLIFRNHYVNDLVDSPSDAVRGKRIAAAIRSALAPFFKK
jgi:hypothetical protein